MDTSDLKDQEENSDDTTSSHFNHKDSTYDSSDKPSLDGNGTTHTSTRHFSSLSHANHRLFASEKKQISRINHLLKKHFHNSSINLALTSEELAKLAKLKKLRKSQDATKSPNKTQTLNPESKEKKVPSSRIGRLSSFGGKF